MDDDVILRDLLRERLVLRNRLNAVIRAVREGVASAGYGDVGTAQERRDGAQHVKRAVDHLVDEWVRADAADHFGGR